MKSIKTVLILSAILAALSSASVFAQSGTGDASAVSTPTARQVRKANRVANRAFAAKVRAAIVAARPAIDTEDLIVFAKGGAISLTGYVNSSADSERLVSIAKSVPGVKSVRDITGLEDERSQ